MKNRDKFIGNKHIVEYLNRALRNQSFVHAYLFTGPSNIGKFKLSLDFAKSVLCQNTNNIISNKSCNECDSCLQFDKGVHADFHLLQKDDDKKNISVESIRLFQKKFYRTSLLSKMKVGIIDMADTLNIEGANALLKTLEEPPGKSIIILISENFDSLPSTVVSRCQIIPFTQVAKSEIIEMLENIGCDKLKAKTISSLSLGKPGIAVEFFKNVKIYENHKENIRELIQLLSKNIPDKFGFIQRSLGTKKYQERLDEAVKLLGQINIIMRDCMLVKSGLDQQIINVSELANLKKISGSFKYSDLVMHQKKSQSMINKLSYNINPQLALENYFLTMKPYA
jgi:DNA polymerase III subunit delta'